MTIENAEIGVDQLDAGPGNTEELSYSEAAGQAEELGTPYTDAVAAYLVEADWIGVLDGPFVVQARQLARSLDRQLTRTGEVQSALASTFDKVLVRLEARRPPALPAPGDPHEPHPNGTRSIFEELS